jgi:hypothetical protein
VAHEVSDRRILIVVRHCRDRHEDVTIIINALSSVIIVFGEDEVVDYSSSRDIPTSLVEIVRCFTSCESWTL